jgi:type VI secretion system secreted protein Hcp
VPVDIFLKLDGITGEARDGAHKEEIDVLAWSWGMTQSATTHVGGGGGSGKVSVQDLSVTKYIDTASTDLMLACCNGKHFPTALLTVRKAGENPLEYVKVKMEEVIIASVSTGGSGGEDRLTENVSLNFAKVAVDYTAQDETGKAKSPSKTMTWDIAKNQK